ncbi:MAG TPA: RnfABCDGE type electron transport complex subunit D [Clostridia bacterium]|nr:RnfABCDGE type electron transport complex subunit D [Clostridia bacterium]HPQ46519.1 RnfABCDGE type electron transport complex subunit D [Clostridia bacterium]HRX42121.1 RnfABCDGE type electron transport complex subunit D [Clostridia bacterium]
MDLKSKFMKQAMMRKMLYSLVPVILYSIYLFGLRLLVLIAVTLVFGVLSEYLIMRNINKDKAKVSEAVLVSCVLFALTLPPSVPFWVAAVGIVFGIVFGKGVFGGFGRNIFNPAIVARCFVYISFPAFMTVTWTKPFTGFPGGFIRWFNSVDASTSATPLIQFNKTGEITDYLDLLLGRISGSLGETAAILIILCGIYLIVTKTASWKSMAACLLGFGIFNSILYFTGVTAADPLFSILSGGFIFGTVFMITDPVSAPKTDTARIIYGAGVGIITAVIRIFGLFAEGMMFAILVGNMFVPLLEKVLGDMKARKKVAA